MGLLAASAAPAAAPAPQVPRVGLPGLPGVREARPTTPLRSGPRVPVTTSSANEAVPPHTVPLAPISRPTGPEVRTPKAPRPATPVVPRRASAEGSRERGRSLTITQAHDAVERLARQSLDEAPRGKGAKAARRAAALLSDHAHPGLSRSGKVKSRAQQRLFFARPDLRRFAHSVARRGADFKRLPERVKSR